MRDLPALAGTYQSTYRRQALRSGNRRGGAPARVAATVPSCTYRRTETKGTFGAVTVIAVRPPLLITRPTGQYGPERS